MTRSFVSPGVPNRAGEKVSAQESTVSESRSLEVTKVLSGVSTVSVLLALAFLPFAVPLWTAGVLGLVVLFWVVPGLDTDSVGAIGMRRWPEATAILAALIGMVAIYSGPSLRYLAMDADCLVIAATCVAWRDSSRSPV